MTPERLAQIAASAYRHMPAWSAAQFHETLARPDALLETAGDAFVLGIVQFEVAEILALASSPQTQRHGNARRALTRFMAEAARRGATRLLLEVAEPNAPALSLYRNAGFSEIGRRRGYYPQPDAPASDALVMECPL